MEQNKKTAKPGPDVFRMDYPEDPELKNARAQGSADDQREAVDPVEAWYASTTQKLEEPKAKPPTAPPGLNLWEPEAPKHTARCP
eukprot:11181277-Lingulodinium_polyedra.AAC.1